MVKQIRQQIGGLGNLLFKQAYLLGQFFDGTIPDVYVQSMKYWEKHRVTIKSMFGSDVGETDMVALHIRRGDYNNNSFYVNLADTDYYDKAIAMFPSEKFLIFCADRQDEQQDVDDRQWCIDWAESKGINYEIHYPQNTETEDLNKMASCKGLIMANSSFSWWAAFLGDGKVIAPSKWFTDGSQRCDLLEEWIKI